MTDTVRVPPNGEIEKGTTVLVEAEYLGEGRACIIGIGAYGTRPTVTVLPGRMYVGDMQHLVAEIERLRAENAELKLVKDACAERIFEQAREIGNLQRQNGKR